MKKYGSIILAIMIVSSATPAAYADDSYPYAIEPQFQSVGDFHDGVASFTTDQSRGFVDKSGKITEVSEENHRFLDPVEGMAVVYGDDGKCGYMDTTGQVVIDKKYDSCNNFREGMAAVGMSGKIGFVDKTGNEVVTPQYDQANSFHEGMAVVCKGTYNNDTKCGYINDKGELVVPLETHPSSIYDFSEGLGAASPNYYDKTGKAVISLDGADLTSFDQGVARVYTMQGMMLIDKTGKKVTDHYYERIDYFKEGLALVVRDGQVGYIDLGGKEVIAPRYIGGYRFLNGKARVIVEASEDKPPIYALIDKNGKELARFDFAKYADFKEPFENDEELISVSDVDGNVGFINRMGEEFIPLQYNWAAYSQNGFAVIRKGDKFGFIDKTGYEIKPQFKFVHAEVGFKEGLAAVQDYETGLWGFIPSPLTTAKPTASKVLVDGTEASLQAYNIDGNNYFKLRDLAMVLNGTDKSFEISWDGETNAISLESANPYTAVGDELAVADNSATEEAWISTSAIYLDGKEVELKAYLINGNNYFKLRDAAKVMDFGVTWDGATNTIGIQSSTGYVEE